MRIITAIGMALCAVAGYAQIDSSRVVFSVNGDEIKGDEYYTHMEFLPNMGRILESGNVISVTPGLLTIVELINQHLVLQLAKQKNLYPTDAEVDALIKQTLVDDPQMVTRWVGGGRTEPELRQAFLMTLSRFKIQTEGITVSDQEVSDFYHKNQIPGLTVDPRTVTLRMISVPDADTQKAVDADLASGQPFADVAKARSNDVTESQGGHLGPLPTDALPKDVVKLLDQTKVGSSTPWIDEQVGDASAPKTIHVKYLVEAKEAEKPKNFDDVKETIRRKMLLDRGAVRNDVEKEISALRQSAKIQISNKEYAAAYVAFMHQNYHEVVHVGG